MYWFTKSLQDKIRKIKRCHHICEELKPRNNAELEAQLTNSNFLQLLLYQEYLHNFGQTSPALLGLYARTRDVGRKEQFTLHRKWQLSSVVKKHRSDSYLIRWLNERFPGATYIIRKRPTSVAQFHEPIRGVGFKRLLQKTNMPVYLMDEYLASQVYPQCEQQILENFRRSDNPRPYKRVASLIALIYDPLDASTNSANGMKFQVRNFDTGTGMSLPAYTQSILWFLYMLLAIALLNSKGLPVLNAR